MRFILSQPETHKMTKDNKDFFPKDIDSIKDEDDDDD